MLLAAQGNARYHGLVFCFGGVFFGFFADLCLIVLQLWLSGGNSEKMVLSINKYLDFLTQLTQVY